MYFMFKENPSTGYKLVVDTQALNGTMTVDSTFSSQNVTVDGVNMVGTSGMRLFTVTSVKEGSGVFRLHYANPGNYDSSWDTYDSSAKWSFPVQVLPIVSKGGVDIKMHIDPPFMMPPSTCFNTTCKEGQVMSPIDCSCSDFATACPV
jgi:predicted secreted protein